MRRLIAAIAAVLLASGGIADAGPVKHWKAFPGREVRALALRGQLAGAEPGFHIVQGADGYVYAVGAYASYRILDMSGNYTRIPARKCTDTVFPDMIHPCLPDSPKHWRRQFSNEEWYTRGGRVFAFGQYATARDGTFYGLHPHVAPDRGSATAWIVVISPHGQVREERLPMLSAEGLAVDARGRLWIGVPEWRAFAVVAPRGAAG